MKFLTLCYFILGVTASTSMMLGKDTKCGDQKLSASCCTDTELCQFLDLLDACPSNHVYCCDFSDNVGVYQ